MSLGRGLEVWNVETKKNRGCCCYSCAQTQFGGALCIWSASGFDTRSARASYAYYNFSRLLT
jgi:hypothetical protein